MKLLNQYQNILFVGVNFTQAIAYTISFLIISVSIIKSAIDYIYEYLYPNNNDISIFKKIRLSLGESIAIALSFILGVEILKLFFIKTYKQLVIVSCLVIIKLLVSYFLLKEIKEEEKNKYKFNSFKPVKI